MLQLGDTVHTHLETLYISSCTFWLSCIQRFEQTLGRFCCHGNAINISLLVLYRDDNPEEV